MPFPFGTDRGGNAGPARRCGRPDGALLLVILHPLRYKGRCARLRSAARGFRIAARFAGPFGADVFFMYAARGLSNVFLPGLRPFLYKGKAD